MKKMMMLLAAALFVGTGAFAQKQFTGAKTFEVDFSPLGGNPIGLNQIKFRSFMDEQTAFRLGLFVGLNSNTTPTAQAGAFGDVLINTDPATTATETNPLLVDKNSEFTFSIRPGIEKHFTGTERLSPYVGGEVLLSFMSERETSESWGYSTFNAGNGIESSADLWETTTRDGSFTYGVNAIVGCDYYFANSIYLGFEFGFGLAATSMFDTKTEFSNLDAYGISTGQVIPVTSGSTTTFVNQAEQPTDFENGSNFNLGPNVNGGIRLGFAF